MPRLLPMVERLPQRRPLPVARRLRDEGGRALQKGFVARLGGLGRQRLDQRQPLAIALVGSRRQVAQRLLNLRQVEACKA